MTENKQEEKNDNILNINDNIILDEITQEQHMKINELITYFNNENITNINDIIRFLIARDWNIEKTKNMLNEHLQWRNQNLPIPRDSILNELQKGKAYIYGHDKAGRPVMYYRTCLQDPWARDLQEQLNMVVYMTERCISLLPSNHYQFTLILDRENFQRKSADLEFMKLLGPLMNNNYPERVYNILIYPCGWIFQWLYKVCQYFFDPKTRNKIKPLGRQEDFLNYIDADQLPTELGGTAEYTYNVDDY